MQGRRDARSQGRSGRSARGGRGVAGVPPAAAQAPCDSATTAPYYLYVVSEGNDQVQLLRFGPSGLTLEHRSRPA